MVNAMYGTHITVEKDSAWEFRQLAAEVDAANPEGKEEVSDQNEEAPAAAPEESAPEETAAEEAPEEAPAENRSQGAGGSNREYH